MTDVHAREPASNLHRDELAIFLFHGVVEAHRHPLRNYLRKHIDRARFISVLRELKSAGIPMAMEEVIAAVQEGRKFPERAFAITFDDGFENNFKIAAPILDDMMIPATFYVTTSFVDENSMSWIDRLEWCLEEASNVTLRLPWRRDDLELFDLPSRIPILSEIRARVKVDGSINLEKFVTSIFDQCGIPQVKSSMDELDRKMTWAQLRELARCDKFTIGGHTHTHAILSFLDDAALDQELDTSLSLLSRHAGIGPRHYSYPEGQPHCYSVAVMDALRGRGVVCCPTAIDGTNLTSSSLFELKRIAVI